MSQKQVIVAGPVFVDMVYSGLPSFPQPGKEIYSEHFTYTVGGLAITAIGLARLNIDVKFYSTIGSDYFGKLILQRLEEEGVEEHLVRKEGLPTSNTTVLSYNGDRAFISKRGAELKESSLLERIITDKDVKADHLHIILGKDLQLIEKIKVLKEKRNNLNISVVVSWEGVEIYKNHRQKFIKLLDYIDLLFCNDLEARHLTCQEDIPVIMNNFKEYNLRPVITRGEKGAMTLDNKGNIIEVEALKINFLDPTGAGDSLTAGFIAGTLMDLEMKKSLKLGVICGSKSTEGIGGISTFPYLAEVNEIMEVGKK